MNDSLYGPRTVHRCSMESVPFDLGDPGFLDTVADMAEMPYSAILLSGGTLDCSRYSIAAGEPFLVFTSKGNDCLVRTSHGTVRQSGDPLELLGRLCGSFKPDFAVDGLPFAGGAIGYLAYELKNAIEDLPQNAQDDSNLPDIFMFWPGTILVYDRPGRTLTRITVAPEGTAPIAPIMAPVVGPSAHGDAPTGPGIAPRGLRSTFTRDEYSRAVEKIRTYIRNGDVYQVNLSQRFEFPFEGGPFGLWRALFDMNPAPFYAFVNAGDHQVLSTSMERFLYVKDGFVETRPIKGTRKRGQTPDEDRRLLQALSRSPKDDAELSMIVDLLRNDLGRVCRPRSIRVKEHKRQESYQNVHHLVSIVTGELEPDVREVALIRASFPGGSITGCPKVRAMEIIDELESTVRHVYTGSIGYLGWHGNLDLNIAIRTAVIHRGRATFSVGGGVVYDSDPEDEYEETLHKGRTFLKWLENGNDIHRRDKAEIAERPGAAAKYRSELGGSAQRPRTVQMDLRTIGQSPPLAEERQFLNPDACYGTKCSHREKESAHSNTEKQETRD